jgi:type II secretory pathway pseudopilin PulG
MIIFVIISLLLVLSISIIMYRKRKRERKEYESSLIEEYNRLVLEAQSRAIKESLGTLDQYLKSGSPSSSSSSSPIGL